MKLSYRNFKQNSGLLSPLFKFYSFKYEIIISLCLILLILPQAVFTQNANNKISNVFRKGEKLVYEVSYAGIKLGSIIIKSYDYNDETYSVKVGAELQSYDNIPFVTLKAKFESLIDPGLAFTKGFEGNTYMNPGGATYEKIYTSGEYYITERWLNKKFDARDTHKISNKTNDGLSLFFYARNNSGSGKKLNAPVFVANKVKPTEIVFFNKSQGVTINKLDYKINCCRLKGKANWKGIYGLSGDFEGWFSNDEAKVPVLAYLNVIVGKVKIELASWKRDDWNPPKYLLD